MLPILNFLSQQNESISVITRRRNQSIFKETSFDTKYLDEPFSISASIEILYTLKPDLLLTGTSEPGDPEDEDVGRIESVFVNAAKKKKNSEHNYS